MLVVLSIIGILSVVVVLSQRTFNRSILLTYTAYDTAMTIRTAETYGLSSRVEGLADSQSGYGVSFRTGSPNSFILFADIDAATGIGCHPFASTLNEAAPDATKGDCFYDGAAETLRSFSFGNNVYIAAVDVYNNGVRVNGTTGVDIVFARPNTQAYFASQSGYNAAFDRARITLTTTRDTAARSYVCVYRSGQIRVSNIDVC